MDCLVAFLTAVAAIFAGIAAWPIIQEWILPWQLTELQKAAVCFAARAGRNAVWFSSNFKGSGGAVVVFFEGALPINDPLAQTEALLEMKLLQQEEARDEISFAIDASGYQELGSWFRRFGVTPKGRSLVYGSLKRFNHIDFYENQGGKVTHG